MGEFYGKNYIDYILLFGPLLGIFIVLMVYFELGAGYGAVMLLGSLILAFFILVEINFVLSGDAFVKGTSIYKMSAHLYLYIVGIFCTIIKFLA